MIQTCWWSYSSSDLFCFLQENFDPDNVSCFAESMYKHHLQSKHKNGEEIVTYEEYYCIVRTILNAGTNLNKHIYYN